MKNRLLLNLLIFSGILAYVILVVLLVVEVIVPLLKEEL